MSHQGPFRNAREIILASASPRRQVLLASLGIAFQVIPAKFKEPAPIPGQAPNDYASGLARAKAREVAEKNPSAVIVAADTIVVLGKSIMGKPESQSHALEMLTALQGNTHQVITGVSIELVSANLRRDFFCTTNVQMAGTSEDILIEYINTGEPMDKAGAYAIQGLGGFMVESISGSYTNVVGLPLAEVWAALYEIQAVRTV